MADFPIFEKAVNARLDYAIDWFDWLNGDTIASVVWTVPAALTNELEQLTTSRATIWLSGGVLGATYQVKLQITTNSTPARIEEQTIEFRMVPK